MGSYNNDQIQFIRAARKILGPDYLETVKEAKRVKDEMLKGNDNPSARDSGLAIAAANRVISAAAKAKGVYSIPLYIKKITESGRKL